MPAPRSCRYSSESWTRFENASTRSFGTPNRCATIPSSSSYAATSGSSLWHTRSHAPQWMHRNIDCASSGLTGSPLRSRAATWSLPRPVTISESVAKYAGHTGMHAPHAEHSRIERSRVSPWAAGVLYDLRASHGIAGPAIAIPSFARRGDIARPRTFPYRDLMPKNLPGLSRPFGSLRRFSSRRVRAYSLPKRSGISGACQIPVPYGIPPSRIPARAIRTERAACRVNARVWRGSVSHVHSPRTRPPSMKCASSSGSRPAFAAIACHRSNAAGAVAWSNVSSHPRMPGPSRLGLSGKNRSRHR